MCHVGLVLWAFLTLTPPDSAVEQAELLYHWQVHRFDFDDEDASVLMPYHTVDIPHAWNIIEGEPEMEARIIDGGELASQIRLAYHLLRVLSMDVCHSLDPPPSLAGRISANQLGDPLGNLGIAHVTLARRGVSDLLPQPFL